MTASSDLAKPLKTWSHLAAARRRPTEYDIVSTNTLWNTPNHTVPWKMASATPQIQWIVKNRNGSRLKHPNWDAFRDPDRLVYRTYTLMQDGQESYVDGLLNDFSENEHDRGLDQEWVATLESHYAPARYVHHAVQMASGYLVTLAPCSTVANVMMLQCGDQLRWVNRIAYRTMELAQAFPSRGFSTGERERWEHDPAWRGFLELAERALVAWDWGECFMAVNLVLKPALDAAFMQQLAIRSREKGDALTGALLDAQLVDSKRASRVAGALVGFLKEGNPENEGVFSDWLNRWVPLGDAAIAAYCHAFGENSVEMAKVAAAEARKDMGLLI